MPPKATIGDSGMFSLDGAGGDIEVEGCNFHQSEDKILTWFLSWDARTQLAWGGLGYVQGAVLNPNPFHERR